MPNFISEDDIEQAMVQKLQHVYGYDSLNCFTVEPDDLDDGLGRPEAGPSLPFRAFSSVLVGKFFPRIHQINRPKSVAC